MGRGTFRPLAAVSLSLRAILWCQPSPPGLQAAWVVVVREKREDSVFVRSFIGGIAVNDWFVFILQICDVAGLLGLDLMEKRSPGK